MCANNPAYREIGTSYVGMGSSWKRWHGAKAIVRRKKGCSSRWDSQDSRPKNHRRKGQVKIVGTGYGQDWLRADKFKAVTGASMRQDTF